MEPAAAIEAVPDWYKQPCMLGVDEAGRGPVLGSMVYGAAFCPLAEADNLKKKAYADSKTLSEEQRERLFEQIQADPMMVGAADVLTAQLISGKMLSRDKVSLNALAFDSTCKLIDDALAAGLNLVEAYIDTLGDPARHRERLSGRFPGVSFTVCPKADSIYPIVSAASIVAKVTRDRGLRDCELQEQGIEVSRKFGSGYPGDPDTKAWLDGHVERVFGFPSLVRFSWSTCNPILDARAAKVTYECDDDSAAAAGQQTLSFGGAQAGAASAAASSATGRHSYFRARRLQRVTAVF